MTTKVTVPAQTDFSQELREWIEAFDDVVVAEGPDQGAEILAALKQRAREAGISQPSELVTPYVNTIPKHEEVPYPGDRALERRIESLIRWNALAMVHGQNKKDHGIGGHIATYSSLATLLEVGFNHFFHAAYGDQPGDLIYFQGHASPGIYSRAFLLGRLDEQRILNFRHELRETPGLSSYPHPWLMPDFWRFPTVSMGIGPLNADLSGALHALPRASRSHPDHAAQNLGLPRRRRNRRSRFPRRALHRSPREARQPHLRRQLQPPAPRRSGARQRPHHRRAGSRLPRRGLERHQSHLGFRLGRSLRARPHRPAAQAHGRVRRRRIPGLQGQGRRLHPQRVLRQVS